jgi:SAM-dependent methyltransferase
VRCESCGHCCFENFPPDEVLAEYYQTKYSDSHLQSMIQEENTSYYKAHLKELLTFTKAKEVTLLDFGSSFPTLLIEALKFKSILPIGVEFDENARRLGVSQGIRMIHPSELNQIDDYSVDIIRLSHVLEHDTNPRKTLTNLVSKLKSGGILYITQPNFPQIDLSNHQEWFFDVVYPEHLHYFTPASLLFLTKEAGLKMVKFFTHTTNDVTTGLERYLLQSQLKQFEPEILAVGDKFFGSENNYPVYRGMNSFYVGVRR